ncbi:MAG: hypothetical protein ABJG42_24285 [Vibrio splendidus]
MKRSLFKEDKQPRQFREGIKLHFEIIWLGIQIFSAAMAFAPLMAYLKARGVQ